MTSSNSRGYVSIIGTNFLQPIASLLEILVASNPTGPNEVQAGPHENGYAAAIIVLAVLVIESTTNRAQYVRGDETHQSPVEFVNTAYSLSDWPEKIKELFVVRDVVAHNHVWEAQVYWNGEKLSFTLPLPKLRTGYGDKKFQGILKKRSRKSRLLDINLFPSRICRDDAVITLKNTVEFLLFMENENRNYIYMSQEYVEYKGISILFADLVREL